MESSVDAVGSAHGKLSQQIRDIECFKKASTDSHTIYEAQSFFTRDFQS